MNIKVKVEEGSITFCMEENNIEIGGLCCELKGETLFIQSIYVLDEYRRQGVATRLWKEMEKIEVNFREGFTSNKNMAMIKFLEKMKYEHYPIIKFRTTVYKR